MSETSALSRLSLAALRSAEALGIADVPTLFEHLYTFNSLPSSATWERRFSDVHAVTKELGLDPSGPLRSLLEENWAAVPEHAADGWLCWVRPRRYEQLAGSGSEAEFKLYLSPIVEAVPGAVAAMVQTLSFTQATSFKIGGVAADLLRPDKMIAYFPTLADLTESAQRLAQRLVGVSPQGVPFTAEIAGHGLLSWSVDPPARARALGEEAHSWREWVCYQLAKALAEAQEEESGSAPPWQRALEQLRRIGVDTERWLPPPSSWGSAAR